MLVDLARHTNKRTVIFAIEKIRIRAVRNSNANNRSHEKILHFRLPLEPSECHHNELSVYTTEPALTALLIREHRVSKQPFSRNRLRFLDGAVWSRSKA